MKDSSDNTPPVWISQWKTPAELLSSFTNGVKSFAKRGLSNFDLSSISLDEQGMSAHLNSQNIRWRFIRGQWIPSCSCGYPDSKCIHTALLALAFNHLAKNHRWSLPFDAAIIAPVQSSQRRSNTTYRQDHLPLFTETYHSSSSTPQVNEETFDFLVEADQNDVKTMITLQFYRLSQDKVKYILTLDHILGLKRTMEQMRRKTLREWTTEACHLLFWVASFLQTKSMIIGRQTMIRITPGEFEAWRDFWEDHSAFLVERDSRLQIFRKKQYVSLYFSLKVEDEVVRINPIVVLPDTKEELPYSRILPLILSNKVKNSPIIYKDVMYDCAWPVSAYLLNSCFSRGSRSMPLDKVVEYLGPLLEYHYDLVQGDCIVRSYRKQPLFLKLSLDDGDIQFSIYFGDRNIPLDHGQIRTCMALSRLSHSKFELNTIVDETSLKEVNQLLAHFLSQQRSTIPAMPSVFLDLRQYLQKLSPEIKVVLSEELQGLLDENTGEDLIPVLTIRPHNGHYTMQMRWQAKNDDFSDEEIQRAIHQQDTLIQAKNGTWHRFNPHPYLAKREWWGKAGIDVENVNHLMPDELQRILSSNEQRLKIATEAEDHLEQKILLDRESRQIAHDILHQPPKEVLTLPTSFAPILRDYQRTGFEFLAQRYASSIGAILADDMGLGKTIQTLALITAIIEQQKPDPTKGEKVMIICPASVQLVWLNEAKRFSQNLRVAPYVGNAEARRKIFDSKDWDCLLVTYGIARSDDLLLASHRFSLIILDEAQMIKNRQAKISISVRRLKSDCRLALTGTPLENTVIDLWSIMDFLNPDYLGKPEHYLAKEVDSQEIKNLKQRIAPLILRRTKTEVAKELPSRTEGVILLDMEPEQQRLYSQIQAQVRTTLQNGNVKRQAFNILTALMRLRQVCCHPALVGMPEIESSKVNMVIDMARELIEEGHSVLIFSQFLEMLRLVRQKVGNNIRTYELVGETPLTERARVVEEFNDENTPPALFFISLKAGGTGITLTKADYVFILDPWWNPSVERQAIDRTHRIGQDKPVIAYRFVMKNSVEEGVMKIKEEKAKLFDEIIEGAASEDQLNKLSLSAEELRQILFKDY